MSADSFELCKDCAAKFPLKLGDKLCKRCNAGASKLRNTKADNRVPAARHSRFRAIKRDDTDRHVTRCVHVVNGELRDIATVQLVRNNDEPAQMPEFTSVHVCALCAGQLYAFIRQLQRAPKE